MKVLVLGGSGYLASKVIRNLLNNGHSVVATKRKESNIDRLIDINSDIEWIDADVDYISKFAANNSIDCVLNMVCNYGRCRNLYDDMLIANLEFPLRILNDLVDKGVKNFITIGTGLPKDFNMYSFSKSMFSEFGKYYSEKHNISFIELKLEMFYGPDEPETRFIPSIIRKMLRGEIVETTIGTQHRDIIAVEDIMVAIDYVMKLELKGYHSINIGTGIAPSISDIIDYIYEKTGKMSVIKKGAIPMRTDEPDSVADITEISKYIEWKPIYWTDGLDNMIERIKAMEE